MSDKTAVVNEDAMVVTVGDVDLTFNVGMDDYNKFINDTTPTDKVNPAFNLLSRTVDDHSKKAFEEIVLKDKKPNGYLVLNIVGALIEDFGGGVSISLKKRKA